MELVLIGCSFVIYCGLRAVALELCEIRRTLERQNEPTHAP